MNGSPGLLVKSEASIFDFPPMSSMSSFIPVMVESRAPLLGSSFSPSIPSSQFEVTDDMLKVTPLGDTLAF